MMMNDPLEMEIMGEWCCARFRQQKKPPNQSTEEMLFFGITLLFTQLELQYNLSNYICNFTFLIANDWKLKKNSLFYTP